MAGYIGSKAVNLSTTAANVGGAASVGAGLTVDADGSTVLTVDRATSDGTIIDLQKSGSSVGVVGSNVGYLHIGSPVDTDAFIGMGGGQVYPANSDGGYRDNAIDLGGTTRRFRDLHLSGGVYLGGTGSANKISDYETGTWSSTVSGVTATTNTVSGTYTKIGDVIVINGSVTVSGKTSGSGNANFSLPFAPKDADTTKFGLQFTYNDINTSFTYAAPYNGTATTFFYTSNQFALSGSGMGNGVIKFNGTYLTT